MAETAYECRNCGHLYYDPPYSHTRQCFICPECHGVRFEQVEAEQMEIDFTGGKDDGSKSFGK